MSVLEDEVEDSVEPRLTVDFGYGDFKLVGHGDVTDGFCGRFFAFKGCLRVEKHDVCDLYGNNYSGKVFVRKARHWCCKPSCPICYEKGWALREAGNIEGRLLEASKRFGQIEHIVASVPVKDYGLDLRRLRHKVVKVLALRGVVGGVMIFHAFRLDKARWWWYFSPHFHVVGFVLGGYGKCRNCERKWNCLKGCGGFDDRNYQHFLKDGWIVKVLGERTTVFGTAWYQLNHASYKVGVKRFHVATWFGVVSYRRFKFTVEKKKDLCPICSEELCRITYSGDKWFVKDCDSPDYQHASFEDYEENGVPVWFEYVKREWSSGSYEE